MFKNIPHLLTFYENIMERERERERERETMNFSADPRISNKLGKFKIRGAYDKFPDFFVWPFKIVVDS